MPFTGDVITLDIQLLRRDIPCIREHIDVVTVARSIPTITTAGASCSCSICTEAYAIKRLNLQGSVTGAFECFMYRVHRSGIELQIGNTAIRTVVAKVDDVQRVLRIDLQGRRATMVCGAFLLSELHREIIRGAIAILVVLQHTLTVDMEMLLSIRGGAYFDDTLTACVVCCRGIRMHFSHQASVLIIAIHTEEGVCCFHIRLHRRCRRPVSLVMERHRDRLELMQRSTEILLITRIATPKPDILLSGCGVYLRKICSRIECIACIY